MRYVISDIHGEYELFVRLLEKIGLAKDDTLYVCGDVIEKGKHSVKLARLISNMPNARCIAGNHEYAFLKYYRGLAQTAPSDFDGVLQKLQAYFPDDGDLLDRPLVDWLSALPFFLEEEEFVCVHAGAPLDREGRLFPLENAAPEQLVHDRTFKDEETVVKSGKCVFFGHTPTSYLLGGESKIIAYLRPNGTGEHISDYYKVHLDLGTWMSGVLGCFCVETCKCIYVKK